MTELKPCPFCGGEATQPAQNPERAWCTNENCIMAFKIVLKRTWNTRPAPSPSDADDDDFVLAPVKAGKQAPSPSREGWLTEGLERLAKLGNGDRHGNSEGNVIAQDLLRKLDALTPDALRPAGDEGKAARAAIAVCEAAEKMRGHLAPPQPPAVYFKDESEVIALCEALDRYAALSSAPQGWRPIETAPKDGTLVWGADARIPYPIYYSIRWQHHGSHGAGWYTSWDATYVSGAATHWQPLPAAPATKEGV